MERSMALAVGTAAFPTGFAASGLPEPGWRKADPGVPEARV